MDFDWYPWKFKLYRRDTAHLSLAAHGAYRALIDAYMAEVCGPLPDHDRALAVLARCTHEEWLSVAAEVRPFFRPRNGRLWHKRCEIELDAVLRRAKIRSESGKKGAEERWRATNDLDGNRIANACDGHGLAMAMPMAKNATETETDSVSPRGDTGASRPKNPKPSIDKPVEPKLDTPLDLKLELWRRGLAFLASRGLDEKHARPLIGKWCKALGPPDAEMRLIGLLADAEVNCLGDVIPWMEAAIRRRKANGNGAYNRPAQPPIRNGFVALALQMQRKAGRGDKSP
jgi:uncharacterized protein YdaU (DUF1376 family)